MSRRLLVIGASVYHLTLIRRARQLGHRVFATSYLPDDPGLAEADRGFDVSILDYPALIDLYRRERIDAAITAGSDLATLAIGHLNDHFGRTGLREAQARTVVDKSSFTALQQELGLVCPQCFPVATRSDLSHAAALSERWPMILKPVIASGSRGVAVVNNADEAAAAYDAVCESSRLDPRCVMQRLINGTEHGAECLVENGRVVFLTLTHKYKTDRRVPLGHCVPNEPGEGYRAALIEQIETVLRHLNVMRTVVNLDVMDEGDGVPCIIDFGLRSGGNLIPDVVGAQFGLDLCGRVIEQALGEAPRPLEVVRDAPGCHGSIIFGSPCDTVLTESLVEELTGAAAMATEVLDLRFDRPVGAPIDAFVESSHRFGHLLARFDDRTGYEAVLARIGEITASLPPRSTTGR